SVPVAVTFGKVPQIRKVYRPILARPKTNIVKCGDGRRCRRIENASRHLPLSKKAPAANRGQVNRGPWEGSKLSDSHAAGRRNVPRGSALPLRSPYRRSSQWPSPDVAVPGFGVSPCRTLLELRGAAGGGTRAESPRAWDGHPLGHLDRPPPALLITRAKNIFDLKTRGVLGVFSFSDLLQH